VTPIRTATNRAERSITVQGEPLYIVITPDGRTAYVGGWIAPVTPIVTATNTPKPVINIGANQRTWPLALTPDGRTLYVATQGFVIPVATATGTLAKPVRVGGDPTAIAVTP